MQRCLAMQGFVAKTTYHSIGVLMEKEKLECN